MGGERAPPGIRAEYRNALADSALTPDAKVAIPFLVAIDQLARRYGVTPPDIEAMPAEWLYRCLEFMRMEASAAKVHRG